jgi:hypothetical protein
MLRNPERKKQVGKPRRMWEDNIKIDFTEILRGGMKWIHLPQDRYQWRVLVNTAMNIHVP